MPENPQSHRRPGPPHNPRLRELVADKRKWSSASPQELGKQGFPGWHERGYLPHRDEPGLVQFVTFRLTDSFPAELRSEWMALLEVEDVEEQRELLQAYLDKGRGECFLRQPDVTKVVEDSLKFYHDQRYELRAWVIMPNHVHVLFKVGGVSMSRTMEDWKKFTAHAINKLLGRKGQLWFDDYWDAYMRDAEHESQTRQYIEANPVKALLVRETKEWLWSSARLRDDCGRLCL
jgi:putative transposase